jgi:hypothetical protein
MKEINKAIQPKIGTFYLLTFNKVKTPWLPTEKILFVQSDDTFIEINLLEGAGFHSRWDWATQDAVTISKLLTNKALVEKLNRSIKLGETIARAELPVGHPYRPLDK